ncbi:hypothetical protein K7432_001323 [Basidiobolus ranarum]|uniref:Homeobox domain-containing protein n=1 Tax=Basidiobolus ranarum TaxID=34480 RepID=A0ABR2W9U2_9FUNG
MAWVDTDSKTASSAPTSFHAPSDWVNTKPEEFASNNKPTVNPRKPRRRTNKEEQTILEEAFQVNHRPSSEIKEQLARQLNMSLRTVQIWFQNRRQSLKKKKYEPLIVPQELDMESKDCEQKKKRNFTVLKLNCRTIKRSQLSWHYESKNIFIKTQQPKESPDLPAFKKVKLSSPLTPLDSAFNTDKLPPLLLSISHTDSSNLPSSPMSESTISYEESHSKKASETCEVGTCCQLPPIRNMVTRNCSPLCIYEEQALMLPSLTLPPLSILQAKSFNSTNNIYPTYHKPEHTLGVREGLLNC